MPKYKAPCRMIHSIESLPRKSYIDYIETDENGIFDTDAFLEKVKLKLEDNFHLLYGDPVTDEEVEEIKKEPTTNKRTCKKCGKVFNNIGEFLSHCRTCKVGDA